MEGDVPVADAGLRGGDNCSSERFDAGTWLWFRGLIGTGAVGLGLLARGAGSIRRVFERRGGGKLGFGFSSASCSSLADLKDVGESGVP